MDNNEHKKVDIRVLEGYDEDIPDIDLLDMKKEIEQERIDREKKRVRKEEWTQKYANSPIPPDLQTDYISRTPTPTYEMMKPELDKKRKEDRWEEGRKRAEKSGGRRRTRRKSNKRKSKSSKKKKSGKRRKVKHTKKRRN